MIDTGLSRTGLGGGGWGPGGGGGGGWGGKRVLWRGSKLEKGPGSAITENNKGKKPGVPRKKMTS